METIDYPLGYRRVKTREVSIGPLKIGGNHPICIQSMLTSSTQDTAKCLAEIRSLVEVDCSLIRLTIPSRNDLENIHEIRRLMKEEGINTPLVADIHFSPTLAVDACDLFEKIRINPGNYSDKPKQSKSTGPSLSFEEGYEQLKETISPLVKKLKQTGSALRVGVNQGSLSSRIIERFGDSPQGMVYSALEMVELFEEQGFHQIVVSLKSSNPIVVQKAYRLLVEKQKGKEAIPLHLGVTEAGNGIMGRIKSLAGIGGLLLDGIGDTIRVSLTEPSANEILFAEKFLQHLFPHQEPQKQHAESGYWQRPFHRNRILNTATQIAGELIGEGTPLKIGSGESLLTVDEITLDVDFHYSEKDKQMLLGPEKAPATVIADSAGVNSLPTGHLSKPLVFTGKQPLYDVRLFYRKVGEKADFPVGYRIPSDLDDTTSVHLSGLLAEGLLDFVLVPQQLQPEDLYRLICLLQATRSKILTTDYIICPSCGRTLFDIQSVSEKIKAKTAHLKGLKIGVMGCIVNGPGEMADADFGYVGSGTDKVDLYFGQEKVKRGIPAVDAVDCLLELIKEKGFWKEADS